MPKGCPRWTRLFGRDLKHWLYDVKGAWPILPEGWDTWLAGGCWVLARALHEWIGKGSEIWAVYSEVGSDVLHPDIIPQHVVVKIGDCFLDGDGASNEAQLLKRWGEVEGLIYPELRPVKIEELESVGIECPVGVVRDLVKALDHTFRNAFQD
jgi:hypothetical protein